jgi:hypothetical protein
MLASEVDFLVRQERYKDLLREAAHERLIRAAKPRPSGNRGPRRELAGWLGARMVGWGCALLPSNSASVCDLQPAS